MKDRRTTIDGGNAQPRRMGRADRPGGFPGLLAIAALLGAVVGSVGCASDGLRPAPRPDGALRVATFNLYHDKADWPARRELVLAQLRELDADVVALQEVIQKPTVRNQAEDLGEALGYQVSFVSIDPPGGEQRYGNALLTRLPVLARDWKALRPLTDSRSAGLVRVDFHGRPVNVYFTHLHWRNTPEGAAIRERQVQDLLGFIDATRGDAPSIVAGDFNATGGSAELARLEARFDNSFDMLHPGANDDPRHATLNPRFFKDDRRRIDHIHAEHGAFAVVSSRVVLDRSGPDGTPPSDHFGLFSVLRLEPVP